MKKYLVKRYIESVDPGEINVEDREYAEDPQAFIEMYGMEDMKKLGTDIYEDDDSTDVFWIKRDERGCYVTTYSCVQNEEVDEEVEIFELFKYKLIKLEDNIYVSAHDPELHVNEYEDCLLVVEER